MQDSAAMQFARYVHERFKNMKMVKVLLSALDS